MVSQQIVWLAFVAAVEAGKLIHPPRETTRAEEVERSATGVSPAVTSRPEHQPVELFRRQILGSNTCGWFADFTSEAYTCEQIGASCINVGSIRGCCNGPSLSCTSTFWTTCIPFSAIPSGFVCSGRTRCCRSSQYPECGAYVMTSSAAPDTSYTMHGCFLPNFGRTLMLQDTPPPISIPGGSTTRPAPPPSTITIPAPGPTTIVEPPSSSPPIGAIVGGVVGGLAVLALLILGIVFMRRRKPHNPPTAATPAPGDDPNAAYNGFQNAPYGKESPYSPTEASPTFAPQTQFHNMGSNPAIAPAPPLYDPRYSVTSSHTQGGHPGSFGGVVGPGNTPSPNPSTDAPFSSPAGGYGLTRSSLPQTSMVGQAPAIIEGDELFDWQPTGGPPGPPAGMAMGMNVSPGGGVVGSSSPPPPMASAEVEAINPFGTKDNRAELPVAGEGR